MTISSLSFNAATRATIMRLQTELKDATSELSSGRLSDVGLQLGRLTGEAVQYHSQESSIQKMLDSNKLVTSRLELMDDTLTGLRDSAQTVSASLTTLLSDINNPVAVNAVRDTARSALESMIGSLNLNVTGQFIFAGAQTDMTPMQDASVAVGDRFRELLADNPAMTASDLKNYLSGTGFAGQKFDDAFKDDAVPPTGMPSWSDWSNGSDTPIVSRISKNETIESSLTTHDQAFRDITAAYALLASVDVGSLSSDMRKEVATAAIDRLSSGVAKLTSLQASIGNRINRVELADTALTTQKDLVTAAIDRLEGVDPSEVGLRIAALETQLQASFTVTGRLKNLSLLNYL